MAYLVISCSLNPDSKSRLLAKRAHAVLDDDGVDVEYFDLREAKLPLCDGDACYNEPGVRELTARIADADAVILATPVYNFSGSAACKNLIELTGKAWTRKVVGFMCAAGGASSYMSVMSVANMLMLDFRCIVVPRYVYAAPAAFEGLDIIDAGVEDRVRDVARTIVQFGEALRDILNEPA